MEEIIELAKKIEKDTPTHAPARDQAIAFIMDCKRAWPAPESALPPDWSTAWESWPYLFTFYWLSPYYLMIPQISLLLNIRHAIRGHARPVMFRQPSDSNESPEFIFRVDRHEPREQTFYLCDCTSLELRQIEGIHDEETLLERMRSDAEAYVGAALAHSLPLIHVSPDPDGEQALERILERDESVIPLLAEKYLDYMPEATTPEMEIPGIDVEWGSVVLGTASEDGEEIDRVRTDLRQLEQLTEWQKSLENNEVVEVEEEDVDSAELKQFMSVTDAVLEEGLQQQAKKVEKEPSTTNPSGSESGQQDTLVPDEEGEITFDIKDYDTILETIDRMKEIVADLERDVQEEQTLQKEADQILNEPEQGGRV